LLDDPLSAVDPEVANAIYNDCIVAAAAQGKIVILVTHQLQFIKNCQKILVISEKGVQVLIGTYE
jgi:ATP-binding cassette subfamily C (CFTR/MRP) protein 4